MFPSMGYHVTILRTKAGRPDPISPDEVVRALASMGGRLAVDPNLPQAMQLIEPSKGELSELLFVDEGELWAKSPGDEFVALMIELAELLGARVRGDEFETYRAHDDVVVHPDDAQVLRAGQGGDRRGASARGEWIARCKVMGIWALVAGTVVVGSRMVGWR